MSIEAGRFAQVFNVFPNEVYLARKSTGSPGVFAGISLTPSNSTWTIGEVLVQTTTGSTTSASAVSAVVATSSPSTDGSGSNNSSTIVIVGAVLGVLVVCAVIAAVFIIRRRRNNTANFNNKDQYDVKLSTLARPGAGAGITNPPKAASWDDNNSPSLKFRNGVDAYGHFPAQNYQGAGMQYSGPVTPAGDGIQRKKTIGFAPDTKTSDSTTAGKFGTMGTFGRRGTAGRDGSRAGEGMNTQERDVAPDYIVTPPTLKQQKQAINTSKAARRASLAWWAAPGVQQQRVQQVHQQQYPEGSEYPSEMDDYDGTYPSSKSNDTRVRVNEKNTQGGPTAKEGGFFQTVSRTVGTLALQGAGAGSANNFDYYDQTLKPAEPAFLQQDPNAYPAPSAMGPGSRLRVIHAHRAELEDELTMYPGDAITLLESYGDGWCLGKVVRSRTLDTNPNSDASRVGEEGMLPIACLDIMHTARLSVAVGEDGMPLRQKRGRSLLRPESLRKEARSSWKVVLHVVVTQDREMEKRYFRDDVADITTNNLGQLKILHKTLFDEAYNDRFFTDALESGEISKFDGKQKTVFHCLQQEYQLARKVVLAQLLASGSRNIPTYLYDQDDEMPVLTAGEECQMAARSLSAFTGTGKEGTGIPKNFITMAMAIAIVRGSTGVAVVRLKTGGSSCLSSSNQDDSKFNTSDRAQPFSSDVYLYVRYNNNFTPPQLITEHMTGWGVREDMERHSRWHGADVTWADVLMNKISVDRSSIGNALYLVINIAAGGSSTGVYEMNGRKNIANLDKLPVRHGKDATPTNSNPQTPSINAATLQNNQQAQVPDSALLNPQTIQQLQITPQVFLQLQALPAAQAQFIFQNLTPQQLLQVQQLQILQQQASSSGQASTQISTQGFSGMMQGGGSFPSGVPGHVASPSLNAGVIGSPATALPVGYESQDVFLKRQQELVEQQRLYQSQREQAEERARQLEAQAKELERQRLNLERELSGFGAGGNIQAFGGYLGNRQ
ncbi:hypothetical protein HDU96_005901 [Phlyctochytrium bullatum]|nr:hypothetical protein HDU96_005901 [Phlyctochytrium bullatum]